VYELGISRHPEFLSASDFVLGYADLLLAQGNRTIFRSLMERALAACNNKLDGKWESQEPLWDYLLKIEAESGDPASLQNLEKRRRAAFEVNNPMGIVERDSISVILQNAVDEIDGDSKGLISGGLERMAKRLQFSRLEKSGCGKPDASFLLRNHAKLTNSWAQILNVKKLRRHDDNVDHAKLARERLAKLNAELAKETPEWLRNFIKILPVNRRMNARPPVEITELVIQALVGNALPPKPTEENRPDLVDGEGEGGGKKRRREEEEEEEDTGGSGHTQGVGGLFRARQKAKLSGI